MVMIFAMLGLALLALSPMILAVAFETSITAVTRVPCFDVCLEMLIGAAGEAAGTASSADATVIGLAASVFGASALATAVFAATFFSIDAIRCFDGVLPFLISFLAMTVAA